MSTSLSAPPLLDDPGDLAALRARGADPDELFASFAAWAEAGGTTLYPAQEEALIELVSGAKLVAINGSTEQCWRSRSGNYAHKCRGRFWACQCHGSWCSGCRRCAC